MHGSSGGVLFYEIMQNSDITLGLRPRRDAGDAERDAWADRTIRAIHLEPGADGRTASVTLDAGANRRTFILACEHFVVERMDLAGPVDATPGGRRFEVLTVIEGEATVSGGGVVETLRPGQTCLLPAGLASATVAPAGACSLLRAYAGDLDRDVVSPLRAAGKSDDAIAALGGRTTENPLLRLL
jgi:mannose-6-phosphate isomerase